MKGLKVSHGQVYLLTFFLGWAAYGLKMVSIVRLLSELGLKAYPPLMVAQAFMFYGCFGLLVKLSRKLPLWFYSISLIFAGAITFLGNYPGVIPEYQGLMRNVVSSVFFLASVLAVSLLEITGRLIQNKNISLLKNPRIPAVLCIISELGTFSGALSTLLFFDFFAKYGSWIHTSPLLISLPLVGYLGWKSRGMSNENELVLYTEEYQPYSHESENDGQLLKYPFVSVLVAFSSVILLSKYLQGFAVFLGLLEWKGQGEVSIINIYSKFAIYQTLIVIAVLMPSAFRRFKSRSWGVGTKTYFSIQSIAMGSLVFMTSSFALVGTGILRKIMQRVLLNPSLSKLTASLPSSVRMSIRAIQERYGQLFAGLSVAALTSIVIYGPVPKMVLWLLAGCCCLLGLFVRKKLLERLNEFQVSNLIKGDIFEAVNSCFSLANEESRKHHRALVNLLKQNPHPDLAKAVIHSLGMMREPQNVNVLINYYHKNDWEELQLGVVEALRYYRGYEIDLFFKKALFDLAVGQTKLGEVKTRVFLNISKRIPHLTSLTILEVLEKYKDDELVLSNTVLLLGELAKMRNDADLYKRIVPFLDDRYSRRTRVNAILSLYRNKEYHHLAVESLDALVTSQDIQDRGAVAFLAGSLQLKGLLPYIIENSKAEDDKNSTFLVPLLKLGYFKCAHSLADIILSDNKEESLKAIHQLSTVSDDSARFKVYSSILERDYHSISKVILLLDKSRKDFTYDKAMLIKELNRLGIEAPKIRAFDNGETTNVLDFSEDVKSTG